LETAVPVCLTELYHPGILSLSDLIAKFTAGPADVLGMEIGTLAEAQPADITVINPDRTSSTKTCSFPSRGTPRSTAGK